MKDALEKLKEFHRVFGAAARETPGVADSDTMHLRFSLMREELDETAGAMLKLNYSVDERQTQEALCDVADGLADLCYVVIGTAVAYGIPLDRVFDEVHRANMAKAPNGVIRRREGGKILKPEGWQPPDIRGVLGL